MTTDIRTTDEILDDCKIEIFKILLEDAIDGASDYAWVRVYPDGSVVSGRAPSWECGEDEYYGRTPHPMTVWSQSGFREMADPSWGMFTWSNNPDGKFVGNERDGNYDVVDGLDDDKLAEKLSRGWVRFDLDYTDLVEPMIVDDATEAEMLERIEEWSIDNLRG